MAVEQLCRHARVGLKVPTARKGIMTRRHPPQQPTVLFRLKVPTARKGIMTQSQPAIRGLLLRLKVPTARKGIMTGTDYSLRIVVNADESESPHSPQGHYD